MLEPRVRAAGWYHASLLAALPWIAAWRPHLAPVLICLAAIAWPVVSRSLRVEPWASGLVVLSALAFLVQSAGWAVSCGWVLLAGTVAGAAWWVPRAIWGRPDAADLVLLVGWAAAMAARPELVAVEQGGWLAPLLMALAGRRLVKSSGRMVSKAHTEPGPPIRDVRGTFSMRGVVAAQRDGLVRTTPLDLELRAGDSLAVLCDAGADRRALADVMALKRPPASGVVLVDGMPVKAGDRLVAVVAMGETFVPGGIALNVGALCVEAPDREALEAVSEACSLAEVADALGDGSIGADGAPLDVQHRVLVLAARVIPSSYRLVVVVDPMPWVNAVRGEIWRTAVVRASVGRTSIWFTADRELANRANRVVELKQGTLRPVISDR